MGGADVCSNDWKYGIKLKQNDSDGLSDVLDNLDCGKLLIPTEDAMSFEEMSYSYRVNRVLLPKMGFEPLAEKYKF